ncbi:MAG: 1-hydroxycarotenoid 3,4-desaturase CrtD [Pseudomonadota bacterium]
MTHTPRIAVVGGGIGGLAAAAVLSRDFDVQIFEAADRLGGKIRQTDVGAGLIDCGPTVFTMRWVFDELFEMAGSSFDQSVTATPLDVLARHGWCDGSRLDLFADPEQSVEAISAFSSPEEGERYLAFCKETEAVFETLHESFMRAPSPDMASLMMRANPFALLATKPFTTLWSSLSRQFTDPRLQQLFGRYSTYCGSSPFQAPATLMLIAHVERVGVWTLEGGMAALVHALTRLLERNGAEIHLNAPVSEIGTGRGRADSVTLEDGQRIEADTVVFNGDRAALARGFLGEDARAAGGNALRKQRSQSAMTWCMEAEAKGLDLSVHNVLFSDDYKSEFDAVFDKGHMPKSPTTYIFAPDRENGGVSAGDRERLFCLINAPSTGDDADFPQSLVEDAYRRMTSLLEDCGLKLTPNPSSITATTPEDFATRFPGTGGALYGMATHGWHASFARPGPKSKIPGLYLTGGSVHPGPGVPMAALSGISAAKEIRKRMAARRSQPASVASGRAALP